MIEPMLTPRETIEQLRRTAAEAGQPIDDITDEQLDELLARAGAAASRVETIGGVGAAVSMSIAAFNQGLAELRAQRRR